MASALIDIPKTARRGDILTLRALIAHPMETGYRRDISGAVIPREIIHTFTCFYDGAVVFAAELFPAIAANPFFQFTTIATRSGPITLTWIDDHGTRLVEVAMIEVTG